MHRIFETIQQYRMIEEGMHVIAGISGGADSVCLLHVLCEYRSVVPFSLTAVHVEHGLRGEESLADAEFTEALCLRLGVPCVVEHVTVEQYAKEEGISVEEAGRRERYRIFHEMQKKYTAQRIAVAHNQNDQAETVLWNLARGSGLKGLCGMSPIRGDIIRPLLFTDRRRIEEILTDAGLTWRTDRTNLMEDYTRNRIRLSLLPQMEQTLNSRAAEHIAEASARLRQVQEYLERMTDLASGDCVCREEGTVCIRLPAWRRQDPLIRRELLKRAVGRSGSLRDFGSVHMEALEDLCGKGCGKELCLPGRIRAVREGETVKLYPAACQEEGGQGLPCASPEEGAQGQVHACQEEGGQHLSNDRREMSARPAPEKSKTDKTEMKQLVFPVRVPGVLRTDRYQIRTELCRNSPDLMRQIIVEKKYTKWLSCDTIDSNILQFRTRRPGDYLVINREGGRKKLKDYLIDCKVPRSRRDQIWLLTEGQHVLWAVGLRISEVVKVTENTLKIMKIHVEERQDEGEGTDSADGTGSE